MPSNGTGPLTLCKTYAHLPTHCCILPYASCPAYSFLWIRVCTPYALYNYTLFSSCPQPSPLALSLSLSLSLSFSLSLFLSLSLCLCLSLSIYLYLSVSLSLSLCLCVSLSPSLSLSAIGAPGCDEAETQGRQSIPDHATTPLIHGSHMTGLRGSSKKEEKIRYKSRARLTRSRTDDRVILQGSQ